jgi:CRISPR-associated protein Cas1
LADDPEWEPVRLFPPEHDGQTVHLTVPGARVSRASDELCVEQEKGKIEKFPVHQVRALVIHGYAQLSTQALHLCARNSVPVHWMTVGGNYVGGLAFGLGGVQRRIRQYQALCEPNYCLRLSRRLATAKAEGQLRYLLRGTRTKASRPEEVINSVRQIRQALKEIQRAEEIDTIRGHEGLAAKAYFAGLPWLISPNVSRKLVPQSRNRRPPQDPFNALLSFGYSLLYRSVLEGILVVGLEPAFGFFHQPRSAAYPLVLDIMELFRVPVWDMTVIGSINRQQWDPEKDFMVSPGRVWLNDIGRRKAIEVYERRLQECWKHPVMNYSLSYARTIELEVRLLEKEWTGQSDLFARARLR